MRVTETLAAIATRLQAAGLGEEAQLLAHEITRVRTIEFTLEEILADADEQRQIDANQRIGRAVARKAGANRESTGWVQPSQPTGQRTNIVEIPRSPVTPIPSPPA